jgi:membrane-bound lytic murein transglycosylase MltF
MTLLKPSFSMRLAWVALGLVLATTACSRAETPGPEAPPLDAALAAGQGAAVPGAPPSQAGPEEPSLVAPEKFRERWKPWKGDLDGIVERRVLRMLVTTNATNYYVDLGKQGGVTYELGHLLEKELNRRFKKGNLHLDVIFLPVTRDRLIPALLEGHGDIAAASLTITKGRLEQVDFSDPLTRGGVKEIVVTSPGAPPVARVEDLSGQKVHVRASSNYFESLEDLNASFAKDGLDPVEIVPVDERLETEDVLEMVNAGVYPITIADDFLVDLWGRVLKSIQPHPDVTVNTGTQIGWAMRKGSPKLKGLVNEFVKMNRQGTLTGNILINRYLKDAKWIKNPGNQRDAERFQSMVELFRKYGDQYDLNYLLVTAQAYQESGLDQNARSGAGAVGVMQLLPSTARDKNVGIPDIHILENNIHAGVKYLRFILDRYYKDAPMDEVDRHLFAFASYNAGPARVAGLRKKAKQMGLDPNQWRGHVELVAAREIGRETVTYVANILKYSIAYRLIEERRAERSKAKTMG